MNNKQGGYWVRAISAVGMALLSACTTLPPAHYPKLAPATANLIPVRDFVANRDSAGSYRISPDGTKLAWMGVLGISVHIFVKDLEKNFTTVLPVGYLSADFSWAQDSRHLLFNFHSGDENGMIFRVDTAAGDEATKFHPVVAEQGVSAWLVSQLRDDPAHVLAVHNRRDHSLFDLYKVNLFNGEQTLLAENPGNLKRWLTNRRGEAFGYISKQAGGGDAIFLINKPGEPVYAWAATDDVTFVARSGQGDRLFLLSNKDRDRVALVEISLATGIEKILHADARVDLAGVTMHPTSGEPLVAYAHPDYPEMTRLHPSAPDFSSLGTGPASISMVNSDREFRRVIVQRSTDKGTAYFMMDQATGEVAQIGASPSLKFKQALADVRPVSFESRDHVLLHGYLTLPVNVNNGPHPMVLLVHGGPWARDGWYYNPEVQFLANRGYAVLQVNFRGSSGYGRKFQELAVGEFAGKMQDDLLDAVQWAITQGHADPQRIAISGASYGGYAALVGLVATPKTFACGIDKAGPTDLVKLIEEFPSTWKLDIETWHRYAGDPAKDADRKNLRDKSPLFQTERIERPLLVVQGGRDPRVRPSQSIELVKRLEQQNKSVDFLLFPSEGHGVVYWPNSLKTFRKTENFLAGCLGGRDGGFDFYQLGAWLF